MSSRPGLNIDEQVCRLLTIRNCGVLESFSQNTPGTTSCLRHDSGLGSAALTSRVHVNNASRVRPMCGETRVAC